MVDSKGADWDRAIDDALGRCSCFLIVLSPDAVASEEVRGELRTAHDLRKPIVPVLFRTCEIPRLLKLIQYVDLSSHFENAADGANRVREAIHGAIPGETHGVTHGVVFAAKTPENTETLVKRLQLWAKARPFYLLALGLPPLAFATGHLFRLPVEAENTPTYVFLATGALCLLAFWLGNCAALILTAALVGSAFVIKPLLVPFEGFANGQTFPYTSATAQRYWLPGSAFLLLVAVTVLLSKFSRLVRDFRGLRPNILGICIASIMAFAAYSYFSRATLYDVYLPFRPQYRLLREHLRNIAGTIDGISAPIPLKHPLHPPLVLNETGLRIFSSYVSTTGHLLLYQHLTEPDSYFGEIEDAFNDNLHLYLRNTGPDPVLYQAGFAQFASGTDPDKSSLEHVINAPYIVVVKPLKLDPSKRVDAQNIARSGPYRVVLLQLKRDEILFAADIEITGKKFQELKAAMNAMLEQSVAAKILQ